CTSMVSATIKTTNNPDRTQKLRITLPISLLQKFDIKRGDIPSSKYVRRAVESYQKRDRIKSGN
ncbi:MAG: hypothetical protein ACJ72Q_00345, partial [Nitrososphaeraceae archaeon]